MVKGWLKSLLIVDLIVTGLWIAGYIAALKPDPSCNDMSCALGGFVLFALGAYVLGAVALFITYNLAISISAVGPDDSIPMLWLFIAAVCIIPLLYPLFFLLIVGLIISGALGWNMGKKARVVPTMIIDPGEGK